MGPSHRGQSRGFGICRAPNIPHELGLQAAENQPKVALAQKDICWESFGVRGAHDTRGISVGPKDAWGSLTTRTPSFRWGSSSGSPTPCPAFSGHLKVSSSCVQAPQVHEQFPSFSTPPMEQACEIRWQTSLHVRHCAQHLTDYGGWL